MSIVIVNSTEKKNENENTRLHTRALSVSFTRHPSMGIAEILLFFQKRFSLCPTDVYIFHYIAGDGIYSVGSDIG